jgi:hypothetical protein
MAAATSANPFRPLDFELVDRADRTGDSIRSANNPQFEEANFIERPEEYMTVLTPIKYLNTPDATATKWADGRPAKGHSGPGVSLPRWQFGFSVNRCAFELWQSKRWAKDAPAVERTKAGISRSSRLSYSCERSGLRASSSDVL